MSSTGYRAPARRMLLVEDDAFILSALELLLEPFFEVQPVSDGANAERWLAKRRFDVAFVDYMLPDTNGIELLRRLREIDPAVRRVVTSGWLIPELISLVASGLVHAFVLKPAPPEEIVRVCTESSSNPRRFTW